MNYDRLKKVESGRLHTHYYDLVTKLNIKGLLIMPNSRTRWVIDKSTKENITRNILKLIKILKRKVDEWLHICEKYIRSTLGIDLGSPGFTPTFLF